MKHYIVLSFLLVTVTSVAQIQKGAKLIEVNLNFSMQTEDIDQSIGSWYTKREITNFSSNPRMGVFVSDRLLLGVGLRYDYQKMDYTSNTGFNELDTYKRGVISFSPYLRHYTFIVDKLYFTIDASLNTGIGVEKYTYVNSGKSENDVMTFQATVSPGLNYFIGDGWILTAGMGNLYYYYSKTTYQVVGDDPSMKTQSFGLSFNVNTFTIGVQYLFGAKSSE
jgi:hypothetical protein